jgi:DNA-binding response OmpR family regulator
MKRILFVDDEPNILDGLKRMLRSQRRVWDMAFAGSGVEALVAMDVEPFDVVLRLTCMLGRRPPVGRLPIHSPFFPLVEWAEREI